MISIKEFNANIGDLIILKSNSYYPVAGFVGDVDSNGVIRLSQRGYMGPVGQTRASDYSNEFIGEHVFSTKLEKWDEYKILIPAKKA
jgi:hypothetical protein